jgi:hypothetical protein
MKPALEVVEASGAAEVVDEVEAEALAGAITDKEVEAERAAELDMEGDMVVDALHLLPEDLLMEEAVMVVVVAVMVAEVAARVGGKHLYHPQLPLFFIFSGFYTNTETESPQNPSKLKK